MFPGKCSGDGEGGVKQGFSWSLHPKNWSAIILPQPPAPSRESEQVSTLQLSYLKQSYNREEGESTIQGRNGTLFLLNEK